MKYVNSYRELKVAFDMVHTLEKWVLEFTGGNKKAVEQNEAIVETKRAIREYLKRKDEEYVEYFDSSFDGCIEKFYLEANSIEEATEDFEENYYQHYYPSQYDCTGQVFTSWYRIFKTSYENIFVVYHRLSVDC